MNDRTYRIAVILSVFALVGMAVAGVAAADFDDQDVTADPAFVNEQDSTHEASATVDDGTDSGTVGEDLEELRINYDEGDFLTNDGQYATSDSGDIQAFWVTGTQLSESQIDEIDVTVDEIDGDETLVLDLTDVTDTNGDLEIDTEGEINVTYSMDNPDTAETYDVGIEAETDAAEDTGVAEVEITEHELDITDNNADVTFDDEAAEVNVTFDYTAGVNQSTIDVSVENTDTGEVTQVVEDGEIVNGSGTIANGDSVDVVVGDLELQEGDYEISASAEDEEGTEESLLDADTFDVDMVGESLQLIPDDTNPLAGEEADVGVVAVDQFGNELLEEVSGANGTADAGPGEDEDADERVGTVAEDLSFSFDDAGNVTFDQEAAEATFDHDGNTLPVLGDGNGAAGDTLTVYNITYTEVGDLEITVFDTGDQDITLSSDTITQTYTAEIDDIEVTADADSVQADGEDTINVTAQILDQNDDPIQRSGVEVDFSPENNVADAGIEPSPLPDPGTDGEGQATIELTAENANFDVEIRGSVDIETGSGSATDTVTFQTVTGAADNIDLYLNGEQQPDGALVDDITVNTTHDVSANVTDASGNAVSGAEVDYFADTTVLDETVTADEDGWANTTFTLPEEKGVTNVNATSGDASADFDIATDAADAVAVDFVSDARVVPVASTLGVDVGAVDEFGNVNETRTDDVDVSTSDVEVISVEGEQEGTFSLDDGQTTFTLEAEDSEGAADITAETDELGNVTETFTVGQPDGIEADFDLDFVTSQENVDGAEDQTTLTAQLLDEEGDEFAVEGVNVSFARTAGASVRFVGDTSDTTDAEGQASVDVEVRDDRTGDTDFLARAPNFDIRDEDNTITASGETDSISLEAEEDTANVGDFVNVSTWFVDNEDRPVAVSDDIQVDVEGQPGALIDDDGEQTDDVEVTTAQDNGLFTAQITVTSDEEGDVDLFALGQGVANEEEVVTFEDVDEPEIEDAGQPTDVAIADGVQDQYVIGMSLVGFDEGQDNVDVYVDVSSLADNGVDLDSLGVDEDAVEATGAEAVDANAESGDQYVRYTFDLDENETSFTVESLPVQDIDASGADATENLTHEVAFTDDFDAAVETGEYDIVEEEIALFTEPLIPDFENPPTNTQELDDELFEDLSGDGDGTDVSQTVQVFGELIRDEGALDGLTDEQAEALAWDDDSPADQVTIGDMVELFGEQIRA